MNKLYPDGALSVKSIYLEIPLEVAQDPELSDAAVLMFGEIYRLQAANGICNAGDEYFMTRRRKSKSTIQALIKELRLRGHITVQTNRHNARTMSVSERYTANFPENRKGAPNFPENRTPTFQKTGNSTHKTPESSESLSSNRNLNSKDQTRTPESYVSENLESSLDLSRFPEPDKKWMQPFLKTLRADPGYVSAVGSARPDVVEMAELQAIKAKKDDAVKSSVLGIIRSVLNAHGDCPADYVAERIQKLRRALGTPKNLGPKSYHPYHHVWANAPDTPKVGPPKAKRVRVEDANDGIDMAVDAEDPAQAHRATPYFNDASMGTLAEAALTYTPVRAPQRSEEEIEVGKRGLARFKAALDAAKQKQETGGGAAAVKSEK